MDATATGRTSLSERTIVAGREVFLGRRRGPLTMLPFAGPAVIASIAYMYPGNFATNTQVSGTTCGCLDPQGYARCALQGSITK